MSELTVTVAVTTPFTPLFGVAGRLPMPGDSWEQLPRARVAARPEETLRSVLSRAAPLAGVRLTDEALETLRQLAERDGRPAPSNDPADHLVWAAFRRADDDDILDAASEPPIRQRDTRLRRDTVVVRDEAGRAVWRRPPFDVTFSELLDAADAGLLDGNPLEPYLIPSIPQGDIGLSSWEAVIAAAAAARGLLGLMGDLEGALALRDRLRELRRRRSGQATEILERHASAWRQRGAVPADLIRLLRQRPRTSAEVAALLGCSEDEAEALLWGIGFTYDTSSVGWIYEGDSTAELIAGDIYIHGFLAVSDVVDEVGEKALMRERLEAFLRTGNAPDAEALMRRLQREQAEELLRELDAGTGRRAEVRRRLRWWPRRPK